MTNKAYVLSSTTKIACESHRVWEKVCFYEHIHIKPSLLLRTILPVPQRTTGAYRHIGDISRCMYSDGGYLTKRITNIAPGKRIDFDIIEQSIRYSGGIVLRGGTIEIEALDDGMTEVRMLTRYELAWPALLLIRYFIERVIGAMHRIVMRDMRERLQSASARGCTTETPRFASGFDATLG